MATVERVTDLLPHLGLRGPNMTKYKAAEIQVPKARGRNRLGEPIIVVSQIHCCLPAECSNDKETPVTRNISNIPGNSFGYRACWRKI